MFSNHGWQKLDCLPFSQGIRHWVTVLCLNGLVNNQIIIEMCRPRTVPYSLRISYLLELDSNYNANYQIYRLSLVIGITYPLGLVHWTAFEDLMKIIKSFVAVLVNDLSISLVLLPNKIK